MAVPVMQIRVMRMLVTHRLVLVPMRMRLRNGAIMVVLVMIVVDVAVFVCERLVNMFVLMPFRQVQP